MVIRRMFAHRRTSIGSDLSTDFASSTAALRYFPFLCPSSHPLGPANAATTSTCRDGAPQPDSGGRGFLRRFIQRRDMNQAATGSSIPALLPLPVIEELKEQLRTAGDRRRFDGLSPDPAGGMSIGDARKMLRAAQMERVKAELRGIPRSSISYSEYVKICARTVSNPNQGVEFARRLEESSHVVVFGDSVFLSPEQVARSVGALINGSLAGPDDPRREELAELEKRKAWIDEKAGAQVWGELYCGLGLLLAQTMGFMRLTFWELSWDVMEPICYFTASLHVAAGYAFFLRTSAEPSFRGYFRRRFQTKQTRLMETHRFDPRRYEELRRACYRPHPHPSS